MKRRQRREVTLVVEVEWDPDVDNGAWPHVGPDHSSVVDHVLELVERGMALEPAIPEHDPGQFRIVGVDEVVTSWNEWGVTVSIDGESGRYQRDPKTIYGTPVWRYRYSPGRS